MRRLSTCRQKHIHTTMHHDGTPPSSMDQGLKGCAVQRVLRQCPDDNSFGATLQEHLDISHHGGDLRRRILVSPGPGPDQRMCRKTLSDRAFDHRHRGSQAADGERLAKLSPVRTVICRHRDPSDVLHCDLKLHRASGLRGLFRLQVDFGLHSFLRLMDTALVSGHHHRSASSIQRPWRITRRSCQVSSRCTRSA